MPTRATSVKANISSGPTSASHIERGLTHVGVDEASSMIGVRPPAVRARIKAGKLPAIRVSAPNGGYVWLIDRADLGHAPLVESTGDPVEAATGAATGGAPASGSDEVTYLRKMVEELQAEKIRLEDASRDRDRDRAREVQELHNLLANSQRLLAVTGLVESSSRPRSAWKLLNPLNWFS